MIAVALRLVARPDTADRLLAAVREGLFEPTRRESGVIVYRFYRDVENPNAFSFVEEWESREALDDHFRSEHVSRFLEQLGDLLAEPPEARFYDVAEVRGLEAVEQARGAGTA